MTAETWRPIPGWDGRYEVSDLGRVRSANRILAGTRDSRGYIQVGLRSPGRQVTVRVHMLVMLAFVGPRPDGLVICHFDDDKSNNHLGNLRYDTQAANIADVMRNGLHVLGTRTECGKGHPFADDNLSIGQKPDGSTYRICRTCRRAKDARRADVHNARRRAARRVPTP